MKRPIGKRTVTAKKASTTVKRSGPGKIERKGTVAPNKKNEAK